MRVLNSNYNNHFYYKFNMSIEKIEQYHGQYIICLFRLVLC